ncbi:MAG: PEGA domain-containing protein [Myxococcales bacterium]|nr:PEGA domain-containing protein [Myxococcales bacterium]
MTPSSLARLLLVGAALAAVPALADKPTVVLPPIPAAKGVTAPVASGFDAHLRSVLGKQASVVDKAATTAALSAAGASDTCATDACGEKLATAAKVRFVLSASVVNNDEIYEVKLSLYDQALHKRTEAKKVCELCAVEEVDGSLTKALEDLEAPLAAAMPPKAPPKPVAPPKPAMVKITITTAPEGAEVILDEKPVGKTPFDGEVTAGKHALVIKKEGFRTQERDINALDKPVTIASTLVVDLSAGLNDGDEPGGDSLAPSPPPVAAVSGSKHTGVGVGMAIGGAVLAGVGTWLIILDGEITCDDGRGRTECPSVYNTKGPGIAGLGVGAGLIGASVATFILDAIAPEGPAPKPTVAPTAGADGAVFQLGGRF